MKQASNKTRINSSDVRADTQYAIRNTQYGKAGLTLVEMVVAMAIMVIVFAAIVPQFRVILNSWDSKAGAAETIQNGRVLTDHLNRNLSAAVRITAVSDSNQTSGYIEFQDNDGNNFRYDIADNNYVEFGPVGDLNDLAGPVSQLQFTCYDACDFNTPITDVNDIRFVKAETTLTNPAPLGQDRTFTAWAYLRTNSNGLVGWWKLDETSGLTAEDSSIFGNDGTLTNMVGDEWTTGVVGGALEFDGSDDYVNVPDSASLDVTGETTVEVWVNPTETTVTKYPTGDVWVRSWQPNNNFSGENQLNINPRSADICRTFIKFDLSDIPSGAVILSATLRYYYAGYWEADPVGRTNDIHKATGSWDESTLTWNNKPGYDAAVSGSYIVPASFGWIETDVTQYVEDKVGGETDYGIMVKDNVEEAMGSNTNPLIRSRETASSPELIVTYTLATVEKTTIVGKGTDAYEIQIDGSLNITGFINNQEVTTQITKAWHHIVLTYDKDGGTEQIKLYVDGVKIDTANYSTAIGTNENSLKIGEKVSGTIDEVRIYNRALTAEEIAPLVSILEYEEFTEAKAGSDVTSITIDTPDTNEGDLLITAVATDGDTSASMAPPVGEDWAEIDLDDYSTEVTLGTWWKLADAPESASHEFTWTGDEQAYAWMMRFTGHDASNPINDSATDGESSSTPTSPAVTTTVDDCIILRLGGFDDGDITVDDPGLSGNTAITMDSSSGGGGDPNITKGTPFEYDSVIGKTPALAQIDSNNFLCAYGGPDKDMGWAVVLTVDTGTWEITKGTAFQFESVKGKTPALIQVDSTHYLCAYSGDGDVGTAVILTVNTGVITKGTPLVYDAVKGKTPTLAQIDDCNYLCAYAGDGDDGTAVILTVDTDDTWEITAGTTLEFDPIKGKTPALAQIDATHFLCAYSADGDIGTAVVLTVDTDAGTVTKETLSPLVFSIVKGKTPKLAQIDSTHYLCAYDDDDLGHAVVLIVNTVTWEVTKGTSFEYDSVLGKTPALAQIDSTNYLCAWDGMTGETKDTGWSAILTVNTGTWAITKTASYEYDAVLGKTPALAQIDSSNYLCAYEGEGSGGYAVVLKPDLGGGDGVVSGGAGYIKQSAAGDSGTSDFALTASQESQMLTIAIAPEPDSGGGGEIRP